MAMSAHTPGPWQYVHIGGKIVPMKKDASGNCLSTIAFIPSAIVESVDEANARLIAAAPDLLSALERVRDADNDCHLDGLQTIPAKVRHTIDMAIAKARGGQHE